MAFNRSKVNVAGNAVNIVHGDQINNVNGTISQVPEVPPLTKEDAFKLLAQNAARNACYNSEQRYPPPNCHLGTRTRILEELSQWIEDDLKTTRVLWLYGSAGVGKSAIAQNLAEKYVGKRVAAAFFFSRNDSSRDKLYPFVASIAHQFTTTDSHLRSVLGPAIVEAICVDRNVFSKSCEHQFRQLITEPCAKVDVIKLDGLPNTIIVDGLDECIDHRSQARLLAMIRNVATRRISKFPIPWVFLVFSRPEPQIRRAFRDFGATLRSYDVNTLDDVYWNIHTYFVDRFAELRREHPALRYEDESWPSDNNIYQLVKRADKQFIFAATVIKYIDTDDELPQDRLDTILRIYVEHESDSPYSDLDLLYHQILSTCRRWEKVQAVLRLLVTPHSRPSNLQHLDNISWRSSEMIAHLLNLRKGEVEMILSRLHSVLRMPEDDDDDIHIAHASFNEFLFDHNRSGEYYTPNISKSEYFDCVTVLLLRTLSTSKLHYPLNVSRSEFMVAFSRWEAVLQDGPSGMLQHSYDYWQCYCKEVEFPNTDLIAALNTFDPCSFMAAGMFHDFDLNPHHWEVAIKWAKSFGKSTQCFVEKWESFLQGFYIAFPPVISPQMALCWAFDFECHLCQDDPDPQSTFTKRLYSVDQAAMKSPGGHAFLILPANDHVQLPEDWIITHATKTNGELFTHASHALFVYAFETGVELLLDDVWDDTSKTVSRGWIIKDDLTDLKSLLKDRAETFGVPLQRPTMNARGTKRKRQESILQGTVMTSVVYPSTHRST